MKRITVVLFLSAIVTGISFAGDAKAAPKPQTPSLMDIPGDGGTNVYVQWRHFETVPGIRYDVLRSADGGEFEVITPLQTKTVMPEPQTAPENDVSEWGYYIFLVEQEGDLPMVKVAMATAQAVDSLVAAGAEKILRVELGVPPADELAKIPNIFALGEFYRVIPDAEIANRPQPTTVPKSLFESVGISVPSLGDVTLELTPKSEELAFVKKGKQILAAGEDDMTLILK